MLSSLTHVSSSVRSSATIEQLERRADDSAGNCTASWVMAVARRHAACARRLRQNNTFRSPGSAHFRHGPGRMSPASRNCGRSYESCPLSAPKHDPGEALNFRIDYGTYSALSGVILGRRLGVKSRADTQNRFSSFCGLRILRSLGWQPRCPSVTGAD
jgi:hypothetical protein